MIRAKHAGVRRDAVGNCGYPALAMALEDLPPRVLSGIQPSGTIHLGNYFGAIQQHIALQDEFPGDAYYFIADYHALTTLRDPEALRKHVFDLAVTYLACGLDPSKALLFRQSDIPEVTELTWLLATVTGMGLLERATSYKEKVAKKLKPVAGLFFYPVLMAADILIYGSSMVPVGKDQVQHVEMARDMATYFNETYARDAAILRLPNWRLSKSPYVPGLDGHKMSKSYGNTLPLFLSGKPLKKAVGQIVTDSRALGEPLSLTRTIKETIQVRIGESEDYEEVEQDKEVPETTYALLQLLCDAAELEQIRAWYATGSRDGAPFGWGHAKALLSDKIDAHFSEARARREHFLAHPDEVEAILQSSAARARVVARATIDACRRATGLA
jgi:tryptophanyl-tRNA synthetase